MPNNQIEKVRAQCIASDFINDSNVIKLTTLDGVNHNVHYDDVLKFIDENRDNLPIAKTGISRAQRFKIVIEEEEETSEEHF